MKGIKALPNTLTGIRILLIPFIILAIQQHKEILASLLIATACLTDLLDGLFARKLGAVTTVGTILDPVADKLFCLSLFSVLMSHELCPAWFLGMLISINLLQLGALLFVTFPAQRSQSVRTLMLGKWNTFFQFAWILVLIIGLFRVKLQLPPFVVDAGYVVLGAMQIVVFFRYVLVYRQVCLLAFRAISAVNS